MKSVTETLAWLDHWRYKLQGDEASEYLELIAYHLKGLQSLEGMGYSTDMTDLAAACKHYGKQQLKYELYQDFVQNYFEWHETEMGSTPRMSPAAGKAMKAIIAYLIAQSKTNDEQGAFLAWTYILSNWGRLTMFLQNQTSLPAINKNLQEIVNQLRNGTTRKDKRKNEASKLARKIAERRGK